MEPWLVALKGLPGSGKSGLAAAVSRTLGWPLLDKDDVKDVLHGRADADDVLAYEVLFRLARRQLLQGLSVVFDTPLMAAGLYDLARCTAEEAGGRLAALECRLDDEAEHRRRIEAQARLSLPGHQITDWATFLA